MLSMASITQNKKDGKVIPYKFKACVGRDEFGKQIFRCTTWKVPDGLIPSRAEKAAQKAAAEWEQKAKDEYKKDLQNPERVREREITKARTDFAVFIREVWFPICICDGEHKPTTVDFNRNISNVISNYFSGKAIQTINGTDIQKYLIYLRTEYRTAQGKPLAQKTIRHHYCHPCQYFLLCDETGIYHQEPDGESGLSKIVQEKGGCPEHRPSKSVL